MKHLDLFSGIGGFALAARRVGWQTVGFCELDEFCRNVLARHWPDVPIHSDIKTFRGRSGEADVVTGGFPCQDVSEAGRQLGLAGERSGLWVELCRVISEVRPSYAVVENVANLIAGDRGRWFGRVLGDLAEIGYDAEWHCISAAHFGAPHTRDRVWIIAYPEQDERNARRPLELRCSSSDQPRGLDWIKANPPRVCGVDDGVSPQVDRLGSLGNAIYPPIAEALFRAINEVNEFPNGERNQ